MFDNCRECGAPLKVRRSTREFCDAGCRQRFNNRRAVRGADFFDVSMCMRFERDKAKVAHAWSLLCCMAANFRAADRRDRAGRRSWDEIDQSARAS